MGFNHNFKPLNTFGAKDEGAPFSRAFNVAVKRMAEILMPTGYDVADEAPNDFEALKAHVAKTGRMLVWKGESEDTIFGCPETNWAFRAWHDWCHIKGGFPFTVKGETLAAGMQASQLITVYGCEMSRYWRKLIACEVVGQAAFHEVTGNFPSDQREFTNAFLDHNLYVDPAGYGTVFPSILVKTTLRRLMGEAV